MPISHAERVNYTASNWGKCQIVIPCVESLNIGSGLEEMYRVFPIELNLMFSKIQA
jgi:hypothetical protein